MASAGLDLRVEDALATVTLNRPERRNAMTPSMWHGLARVGAAIPEQVRVVVLRGAGPSFCAGIDIRLLTGDSPEQLRLDPASPDFDDVIASYQAGYTWLRNPQFVSVAAVQGHAIGAGFQLALACDVRVLADDATLCMKEPALGLVPDLTGTKPLVDIVGLPRAIEMCLTARTVGADEALRLRLAELVVARHELDAAVSDLVAALLSTDAAAARATKALLAGAPGNTLEQQAAAERAAQRALLGARLPLGDR
jgi:enoyl-CoA hydratase/carnithine racemase